MPQAAKKLVSILTTSVPVTYSSKEVWLKRVLFIYYPIRVYQNEIWVLFNSGNKVNAMSPDYAWKLDLYI